VGSVCEEIRRFGEDSVEKMADWAQEHVPAAEQPFVLEVGSGNGTLLFALFDAGYNPTCLAGIDYSPDAVRLAQMVAASRGGSQITFSVCDFLAGVPLALDGQTDSTGGWDLVLDKGTYDAIALGEKDEHGRSPAAGYPERVSRLLKDGAFYLITCEPLPCRTLAYVDWRSVGLKHATSRRTSSRRTLTHQKRV